MLKVGFSYVWELLLNREGLWRIFQNSPKPSFAYFFSVPQIGRLWLANNKGTYPLFSLPSPPLPSPKAPPSRSILTLKQISLWLLFILQSSLHHSIAHGLPCTLFSFIGRFDHPYSYIIVLITSIIQYVKWLAIWSFFVQSQVVLFVQELEAIIIQHIMDKYTHSYIETLVC